MRIPLMARQDSHFDESQSQYPGDANEEDRLVIQFPQPTRIIQPARDYINVTSAPFSKLSLIPKPNKSIGSTPSELHSGTS